MRRLVSLIALLALFAGGFGAIDAAPAQALDGFGTISGTVTFSTAPSWNTGSRSFQVQLIDHSGYPVETSLVPITYSYDGSGGYTDGDRRARQRHELRIRRRR